MSVYTLVVGDLEPDMEIDVSGQLALLTGATSLALEWYKPSADGSGGFDAPIQVPLVAIDLTTGRVKRVWAAGDTDRAGIHKGRVIITCSNSELMHYPNDGTFLYWVISV